jgi:hypothetical protein
MKRRAIVWRGFLPPWRVEYWTGSSAVFGIDAGGKFTKLLGGPMVVAFCEGQKLLRCRAIKPMEAMEMRLVCSANA